MGSKPPTSEVPRSPRGAGGRDLSFSVILGHSSPDPERRQIPRHLGTSERTRMIKRRRRCLIDLDVTATFDPKAPSERNWRNASFVKVVATGGTKMADALGTKLLPV